MVNNGVCVLVYCLDCLSCNCVCDDVSDISDGRGTDDDITAVPV